ncbi:MAG TPA: penicillin-binding transpeptidase domain-containing protein, partial [Trueperaceae bacterium]
TVNNRGTVLESEEIQAAVPGQDVVLTIDPKLQRAAEDALKHSIEYVNAYRAEHDIEPMTSVRGALVAMDPRNGEILAMASVPTFDQNLFKHRPTPPQISQVLTDPELPLLNRAIKAYPPASTFKLVTSSTLLRGGYITPNTHYYCSAYIKYGGIRWDNWSYPASRGNYNVKEALGDSCNTFFWRAAIDTPNFSEGWSSFIEQLAERARDFGYGQPVGLALPGEEPGHVPTEADGQQYFGTQWYPGYTLNASIGQGTVLATPVQVAQLGMTIAMDGRRAQPHLIKSVGGKPKEVDVSTVPGRFWDTLQEGMRLVVAKFSNGGYSPLSPTKFPIDVAGKTGTAQNAGIDHAWFVGYGPIDDPELVVAVFIEHGTNSTDVAIPVAADFMSAYWGVGSGTLATEAP